MKTTLTNWDIQDHLKTAEDRAFYLEAAIDEAIETKDYKFLATAFSDVATALGGGDISSFFIGVSTGLAGVPAPRTARRKTKARA